MQGRLCSTQGFWAPQHALLQHCGSRMKRLAASMAAPCPPPVPLGEDPAGLQLHLLLLPCSCLSCCYCCPAAGVLLLSCLLHHEGMMCHAGSYCMSRHQDQQVSVLCCAANAFFAASVAERGLVFSGTVQQQQQAESERRLITAKACKK